MTNEQYETIIGLLADKIKAQGEEITLQKWQIESLQKQLKEAEYHLNPKSEKAI